MLNNIPNPLKHISERKKMRKCKCGTELKEWEVKLHHRQCKKCVQLNAKMKQDELWNMLKHTPARFKSNYTNLHIEMESDLNSRNIFNYNFRTL